MRFAQRYVNSLLSTDRASGDPVPRPVTGVGWWRRYLASLFDVRAAGKPSSPMLLPSDPDLSDAGGAPTSSRRARTRMSFTPVTLEVRSVARPRLPLLVGIAAAVAAATVFAVTFNQAQSPERAGAASPPGATATPTDGAEPPPYTTATGGTAGAPPSWKGTVTFIAERDDPDVYVVTANPPTDVLDGYSLHLCASSCRPPALQGRTGSIAAWRGKHAPTEADCSDLLADPVPPSVPLRRGQTACISTGNGIGFLTLLTISPDVSAGAVVWHD